MPIDLVCPYCGVNLKRPNPNKNLYECTECERKMYVTEWISLTKRRETHPDVNHNEVLTTYLDDVFVARIDVTENKFLLWLENSDGHMEVVNLVKEEYDLLKRNFGSEEQEKRGDIDFFKVPQD